MSDALKKAFKAKKNLSCNKPTRSWRDDKKFVVKACQDGEQKIVHFGDPNMPIKKSIPENKKSYCARSKGIGGLANKLKANYWSRKKWEC